MIKIKKLYVLLECIDNHFTCKDGKCVDIDAKCDREYDCEDESDEHDCSNIFDIYFSIIQLVY